MPPFDVHDRWRATLGAYSQVKSKARSLIVCTTKQKPYLPTLISIPDRDAKNTIYGTFLEVYKHNTRGGFNLLAAALKGLGLEAPSRNTLYFFGM